MNKNKYLLIKRLNLITIMFNAQVHPLKRSSMNLFQDTSVVESFELVYDRLFEICNSFSAFGFDLRLQQTP